MTALPGPCAGGTVRDCPDDGRGGRPAASGFKFFGSSPLAIVPAHATYMGPLGMSAIAGWARRFGLARALCILLLFALVGLRVADPRPLEELRLRTFDLFQVLQPREQTTRPVVIVDIDEDSIKAL